tara:strand:- start:1249 stop:1920 length:672 start_codon:yes stop_codon:yes gene_type:complete
MHRYNKAKLSFSLVLVIQLSMGVSGPIYNYLGHMTPYHSAVAILENRVFDKLLEERSHQLMLHEQKVKERIIKVAANCKTGLKPEDLIEVSGQILEVSRKYGYDPLFLTALIVTESSFNNKARSRKGAIGLMQIVPRTGYAIAKETNLEWRGKKTLFDPESNIVLGTYYLDKLVQRFGDLNLALEAYNHGPSQLRKYLRKGRQPKRYSRKVLTNYRKIKAQFI